MLFLDEDMVTFDGELIPFIQSVEQGMDVALNRHSGVTNRKDAPGYAPISFTRIRGFYLSGKGLLSPSLSFPEATKTSPVHPQKKAVSQAAAGSLLVIAIGGQSIHGAGTVCFVPIYSVSFSDKPYRFASATPYFSAKLNKTT